MEISSDRSERTMGVSIAIATHNRASELVLTLASLVRMRAAEAEHEILVIDNASRDSTDEVVHGFVRHFGGRIRYVSEPRLGLSHARNRAIAEASYDIVAFLDDDVDVDANWLMCLVQAYREVDCAAIGGMARLVYPGPKPRWLDDQSEGLLTRVDLGPARKVAGPDELYGLNLSLRKNWLDRVGLFRADLGRIGGCLLSSEEEELLDRIVRAGGVLLYEPNAIVGHRVPPERLRRRWFWSRSYWGQRSIARITPAEEVTIYQWLRSTWRAMLAARVVAGKVIEQGIHSKAAFRGSIVLAGRIGFWVGLTRRLVSRLTPRGTTKGPGRTEGRESVTRPKAASGASDPTTCVSSMAVTAPRPE